MNDLVERIAEMPVTEWRGIRVRVSIEVPGDLNSMTTQLLLDERDLNILKYLAPPSDVDLLPLDEANLIMMKWGPKQEQAKRVVDIISNKIAMQITHAIGEQI